MFQDILSNPNFAQMFFWVLVYKQMYFGNNINKKKVLNEMFLYYIYNR